MVIIIGAAIIEVVLSTLMVEDKILNQLYYQAIWVKFGLAVQYNLSVQNYKSIVLIDNIGLIKMANLVDRYQFLLVILEECQCI